jgi:hypothetical protein
MRDGMRGGGAEGGGGTKTNFKLILLFRLYTKIY